MTRSSWTDEDGVGDGAFDRKLRLIAQEHDAGKLLQHRDGGPGVTPSASSRSARRLVGAHVDDDAALADRERRQRPHAPSELNAKTHGGHSSIPLP